MTWAVALVVLVAIVAGAVIVLNGDEASATEVTLEAAGSEGTDPFMDSIATDAVNPDGIEPGGIEEISADPDQPVTAISGATPGLYGGTGDDAVCDPTALVEFLDENPDKAQAFATVQAIQPDDIADYVANLTPVLLREDTRVTNHGFRDGTATPLQSVLQAGTAVLVDDRGVPRVRCSCGNPLTEPDNPSTDLTFTGDPWTGFDDTRLVAIDPSPQPLDTLTITDIDTGQTQDIPTGSGGGGSDADDPDAEPDEPEDPGSGTGSSSAMTVDRLLNVAIPALDDAFCLAPATQLVDGVGTPPGDGSPTVVGLDPRSGNELQAHIADVTGDGVADGVLVVVRSAGAANFCSDAVLFDADGSFLGRAPVEDQVTTGGILAPSYVVSAIEGDTVEFQVTSWAPNDDRNTPSINATVRMRWDGTQFVAA